MIELINAAAEQYAEIFTTDEDELLQTINDYTTKNYPQAHMLSGKVQGQFLAVFSQLLQPSRILEVGTFTGYSALCLAKGLHPQGRLFTIELREEDAAVAQSFFNKSLQASQIVQLTGDAINIIPTLYEIWDIVFLDADKTGYIDYYELILPSVKKNGVIIADNVLFHGQVLQDLISGKNAVAVHNFNLHVKADSRVQQVMLTMRDGISIIRKK